MGNIGFSEIILILIVGFLIFGPEKLPKVARTLGKLFNKFLKVKDEFKGTVDDVKNEITSQVTDLKKPFDIQEHSKKPSEIKKNNKPNEK
jgi:Tat protein translocase TatB subunit